jgi:DUF971 family protein
MKHPPVLVKAIKQKDNFTFTIEWSDGIARHYRLCDLQERCPCAACSENAAGKQPPLCKDVRAVNIFNIGRYALRIQFTSGCSAGIYSFAMLRELGGAV